MRVGIEGRNKLVQVDQKIIPEDQRVPRTVNQFDCSCVDDDLACCFYLDGALAPANGDLVRAAPVRDNRSLSAVIQGYIQPGFRL